MIFRIMVVEYRGEGERKKPNCLECPELEILEFSGEFHLVWNTSTYGQRQPLDSQTLIPTQQRLVGGLSGSERKLAYDFPARYHHLGVDNFVLSISSELPLFRNSSDTVGTNKLRGPLEICSLSSRMLTEEEVKGVLRRSTYCSADGEAIVNRTTRWHKRTWIDNNNDEKQQENRKTTTTTLATTETTTTTTTTQIKMK